MARIGRPSKYKKVYCETVIERMSAGFSLAQIAKELKTNRHRLLEWAKKHPEFRDALNLGKDCSQAFFENILRAHATGQIKTHPELNKSSLSAITFILGRRFTDYQDRSEDKQEQPTLKYVAKVGQSGEITINEFSGREAGGDNTSAASSETKSNS